MSQIADNARVKKPVFIRTTILLLWLAVMFWIVRFEAFPERFTGVLDGYSSLLTDKMLGMDAWMRVSFNHAPIGYGHTTVTTDESDPSSYCEVSNQLHLNLKIMGEQQRVRVNTTAWLDPLMHLQRFEFLLHARGYQLTMKGVRAEGRLFNIAMRTHHSSQRVQVEIPDDVVLYSPLIDAVLRKMNPGESLTLNTFDPTSLATVPVVLRALRRETVTAGAAVVDALVLESDYQGMKAFSWVDGTGKVLRQETAFGWTLETCSMQEAFDALDHASEAGDLLAGTAVPCVGLIDDSRSRTRLRFRLDGVVFEGGELDTPRQRILFQDGDATEMVVLSGDLDHPGSAAALDREAMLQPTRAIQSDHPDIVKTARQIAAGTDTRDGQLRRLVDWVHDRVEKRSTLSLPSALDVLRTMQGDCNEHTYLFVALARALDIPATVVVGVAYHEGAFHYHAWPAVYTDRWVELDPTWRQYAVDATHIALTRGELADQLGLLKVMGRLKITVIEESGSDDKN